MCSWEYGGWRPSFSFTHDTHKFQTYIQMSHALLGPEIIRICLCLQFQDFENSMKIWECKHTEMQAASQPQLDSQDSQDNVSDEEYAQMQHLVQLAENLISR